MINKPIRCAIYTRKSSEEGLEQDFNSLQAQREACEAYIKSQKSENWILIPTAYDDGGYSGGTLERPALQQLLSDAKTGKIDIIVVYKIDRLTRSLMDFSKIIEVLDAHQASFVSITQHFNTTTSMGRLTLNMLLSFAQFEREVTAERIRDKYAASKKKGMWMGGYPPFGYERKDKKLIPHHQQAAILKSLFKQYHSLKSVGKLLDWVRENNVQTSLGKPFTKINLHRILSNRVYIGEVGHKGTWYPGLHQALVSTELFSSVQQLITDHQVNRVRYDTHPSFLAGKLFDDNGNRMSPKASGSGCKKRRYYTSQAMIKQEREKLGVITQVPAGELENFVTQRLKELLTSPAFLTPLLSNIHISLQQDIKKQLPQLSLSTETRRLLVARVDLFPNMLKLTVSPAQIREFLLSLAEKRSFKLIFTDSLESFEYPFQIRRACKGKKIILGEQCPAPNSPRAPLVRIICQSYALRKKLFSGQASSILELAKQEGCTDSYMSRLLEISFLPAKSILDILSGVSKEVLSVKDLLNLKNDQRLSQEDIKIYRERNRNAQNVCE